MLDIGIGHNGGPALDEPGRRFDAIAAPIDAAKLALKTLELLCVLLKDEGEALDPRIVMLKRKGGRKTLLRNLALYLLRERVQINQLAAVFDLYRGTVADAIEEVERFASVNGLVREGLEYLGDIAAQMPGLIAVVEDGFMADLSAEKAADLALAKAAKDMRDAVDRLEREEISEAARIQAALIAKRRADWEAQLARIDARVAEEKAKAKPKRAQAPAYTPSLRAG